MNNKEYWDNAIKVFWENNPMMSTSEIMKEFELSLEDAMKIKRLRGVENVQDEKKIAHPSFGQVDTFVRVLCQIGGISEHYNLPSEGYKLYKLTVPQFNRLKWLERGRHMSGINKVLEQFKITKKI